MKGNYKFMKTLFLAFALISTSIFGKDTTIPLLPSTMGWGAGIHKSSDVALKLKLQILPTPSLPNTLIKEHNVSCKKAVTLTKRVIFYGPKGGRYYYNKNGNKVYETRR